MPLHRRIITSMNDLKKCSETDLLSYMPDTEDYMPRMKDWVHIKYPKKHKMTMIGQVEMNGLWHPWYISANAYEPMSPEIADMESSMDRDSQVLNENPGWMEIYKNISSSSSSQFSFQFKILRTLAYSFVLLKHKHAFILQYRFTNLSSME